MYVGYHRLGGRRAHLPHPRHAAGFLAAAAGLNILVAGSTQASKATMLGAPVGSMPPRKRIITSEEVFELPKAS